VTPLSYRMKKAKQDSEATESQSTGIGQDDVGSEDEKDQKDLGTVSACKTAPVEPAQRRRGAASTATRSAPHTARPSTASAVPTAQGARISPRVREVSQPTTEVVAVAATPTPRRAASGPGPYGLRRVRATVVPPSPHQQAADLSSTLPTARMGAYTVAMPISPRLARSQSPCGTRVIVGTPDRSVCLPVQVEARAHPVSGHCASLPSDAPPDRSVCLPVAVAAPMTPAVAGATTASGYASPMYSDPKQLRRRSLGAAMSCSAPSLFPATPQTPETSLAQLVMQQLNTPARQVPRPAQVPCMPRYSQTQKDQKSQRSPPQAAPSQLKDFKPLLQELFEEEGQNQSAEQLQSKIDQLQKLQQLLQVQQQGLKQQQHMHEGRREVNRPWASSFTPRVGLRSASPHQGLRPGRSGSEGGRRRFLV